MLGKLRRVADLRRGLQRIGLERGRRLRVRAFVQRVVEKDWEIFPEEVAPVDDLAAAHVEQVDGQHLVFVVKAEDVGVFVVGGGDALLILHLVDGDDLVAQAGGGFELHVGGGGLHTFGELLLELLGAAFEEELYVADGFAIRLGRDESFYAGAEAAFDVVLQAGARMVAIEVDLAAWDEEAAMDEIDQPVREVSGEVRAEIGAAILAQAAGDEDLGMAVVHRQLDVGVGLVVAQQNVEARLALLDEVVLERQRLALVGNRDVFEIDRLAHKRAGLLVHLVGGQEVGAHARSQVLRLTDVNDLALGVLVQVAACGGGQRTNFCEQIHRFDQALVLLS